MSFSSDSDLPDQFLFCQLDSQSRKGMGLCRLLLLAAAGGLGMSTAGCTSTPGTRPSIWPTRVADTPTSLAPGATGVTGSIASTTQAVKGQFSSMGTAVSSAYGKAKTAIASPFGGNSGATETSEPTSPVPNSSIGPEVHVINGHLHESQGNYTKALDSYSKALEKEPKNASALLSTARLYERQNDKEKAIDFLQRAATVAPNNAAIFAELGSLQARSGNLAAARSELQKAVQLDSKNTVYRSSLAGMLLDSGNAEGAMAELQQVNSPAMANYQMAYLHFTRKNIPATQQFLGSALQIEPNLKPARDLMASMGGAQNITQMAQQGQQTLQQAKGFYQQAGAIGNNVPGLMNSAPPFLVTSASGSNSTAGGNFEPPSSEVSNLPSIEQASSKSMPLRR